jgi:hypothetical protein
VVIEAFLYNFKYFKALLLITPPPHYIIAYYALNALYTIFNGILNRFLNYPILYTTIGVKFLSVNIPIISFYF